MITQESQERQDSENNRLATEMPVKTFTFENDVLLECSTV
jgi:hypothetical protein